MPTATLTVGIAPAPAAQAATGRSAQLRAPKGGWLDPTSGKFYKGGQFVKMTFGGDPIPTTPAPLVGSWRQIPWATRLRRDELNRIELTIAAMRSALEVARRAKAAQLRREIRELAVLSYTLSHERSAAAIIEMAKAA